MKERGPVPHGNSDGDWITPEEGVLKKLDFFKNLLSVREESALFFDRCPEARIMFGLYPLESTLKEITKAFAKGESFEIDMTEFFGQALELIASVIGAELDEEGYGGEVDKLTRGPHGR